MISRSVHVKHFDGFPMDSPPAEPSSQTTPTSIADSNVSAEVATVPLTDPTPFSIYNRNINFNDDYTSNYTKSLQMSIKEVANHTETNNNGNHNNQEDSTVDDVHNYSKIFVDDVDLLTRSSANNDALDSSTSSVDLSTANERVKNRPDHHARRPMNAFLIFCKRHRTIVREKYPNLENR